ncbi:RNA-binding protein [Sulfolobus acidocaldarius SUSAZ]|nr:RNA-binding protein [Sulfolobus acidocaldarius SUSAZ]
MNRHLLSDKDKRDFLSKVKQKYNIELEGQIEVGKEKKELYYFVNGVLSFFSEEIIPTLCFVQKYKLDLPYVVVDEGAVKRVTDGADLFVPGIVSYNCECKEGDVVLVKTKTNLPIAIIRVILYKDKAIQDKKGKFGVNLHYVSDNIWEMCNAGRGNPNLQRS